jgi:Carboxypeptidase regulatory-like domain
MQVRMLVLAGVAGVCGWVARGVALPEATAEPQRPQIVVAAPPVIQVVMAKAEEPAAPEEEEEVVEEEVVEQEPADGAGEDMGTVIARAQQQVADHNSIYGVVTDDRSGEALAGVTVIVSGPQLASTQAAITDEHGFYKLANLPTGYVLATFYYADHTLERDNVIVSSLDPTPVYQRIDLSPVPPPPPPPPPDEYIINIPTGRTFEGVLLESGYTEGDDTLGVSFSGGSSIENVYVIE